MKNAKKFLSIVLVVALVCSMFAFSSSALEAEDVGKVNVKYAIAETNTIVDGATGTAYDLTGTAYEGDVYALTISVKAAYGLSYLQLPFFYNQDKFGQVTLYDGTDLYYSYNGYANDMGENVVYMYDLGPAWDDVGQYTATGGTAANSIATKCYGLGHASAAGAYAVTTREIDQTATGYAAWTNGITKDYSVGAGFVTLSHGLASKTKAAFMNVLNGKVVTDSYVDIITLYLYNHTGDVAGEEIGAYVDYAVDSTVNIQTTWDETTVSGYPRNGFADGKHLASPWAHFVENAAIAAAPTSILNPLKSQIRFDKNADNTYAGTFAVRQLAVVSKADFENTFGATVDAQKAAIAEVGYVFARTSTVATFDVAAAKALIENGTATTGYTKLTVDYITTKADLVGEGNYGFSCIVANIPTADKADGINALAYIKGTDGTYHYYPAAEPTSFNTLYTAHYNSAFPA